MYQLILLVELLLAVDQGLLVVLGLAGLLVGTLFELLEDRLRLRLILEELLDVRVGFFLLRISLTDLLLEVQLHLRQLMILFIKIPEIRVSFTECILEFAHPALALIMRLLDLSEGLLLEFFELSPQVLDFALLRLRDVLLLLQLLLH